MTNYAYALPDLQKIATGQGRKVKPARLSELQLDGLATVNDDGHAELTPHGFRTLNNATA